MELQCKSYTTTELREVLSISETTWKRRKAEFLEYFKLFFDYTTEKSGHTQYYVIHEIYSDYEPLPRKQKDPSYLKDMTEFYANKTRDYVAIEPYNTGTNIARNITNFDNRYEHKVGTAAKYVRPVLKEEYEKEEIRWMYLDTKENGATYYVPLDEEELKDLKSIINSVSDKEGLNNYVFEKVADQVLDENGRPIRSDEKRLEFANAIIAKAKSTFDLAMQIYKDRHGYRPQRVPMYKLKSQNNWVAQLQ